MTTTKITTTTRRRVGFAGAAAALGACLVWLATGPHGLVHVNWDAGSYLHQVASGGITWSSPPWNAHFAIQYLYFVMAWTARALGGTHTDGFRLLNAICFAICAGLVTDAALHLTRSRLLAGFLAATWATAFVTCFLVFTLEDNIIFLTPSCAILWLCVVRLDRWSWRECVAAGLLGSASALLSIQGVLYLAPPLCLTLFLRPVAVPVWRRAADAVVVVAASFACALLLVVFIAATSTMTTRELLDILFSRPQPSHFPETPEAMRELLLDWRGSLRTIGIAVSFQLFQNHIVLPGAEALIRLGGIALAAEIALWAVTSWIVWRRKEGAAAYLLSATLLLFTLLTSLYRDVEYAYLKRTDFLPLIGAFVAAGVIGPRLIGDGRRRAALAMVLAVVVAWQSYAALMWRHAEVSGYATLDDTILQRRVPGYHGTSSGSYFRRFRTLRQEHPSACAFVFDLPELAHGRWNPDITGLLWSELPNHYVISSAAEMSTWRRPLRIVEPHRARLRGCEWLSEGAKRRLGK